MSAEFLKPSFEDIPCELRAITRWVVWRAEVRGGGKPTKVPYRTDLPETKASVTDPDTWGTFEQAEAAFHDGDRTGIGLVLDGSDNLAGVDIDGCRDAGTGEIDARALALLERSGAAYVEVSPSGTGLRAFGYAPPLETGASGTLDGLRVELYSKGRYLTLTGRTIKPGPRRCGASGSLPMPSEATARRTPTRASSSAWRPMSGMVNLCAASCPGMCSTIACATLPLRWWQQECSPARLSRTCAA
jgi:primase-polymerase (primpol)-like protein